MSHESLLDRTLRLLEAEEARHDDEAGDGFFEDHEVRVREVVPRADSALWAAVAAAPPPGREELLAGGRTTLRTRLTVVAGLLAGDADATPEAALGWTLVWRVARYPAVRDDGCDVSRFLDLARAGRLDVPDTKASQSAILADLPDDKDRREFVRAVAGGSGVRDRQRALVHLATLSPATLALRLDRWRADGPLLAELRRLGPERLPATAPGATPAALARQRAAEGQLRYWAERAREGEMDEDGRVVRVPAWTWLELSLPAAWTAAVGPLCEPLGFAFEYDLPTWLRAQIERWARAAVSGVRLVAAGRGAALRSIDEHREAWRFVRLTYVGRNPGAGPERAERIERIDAARAALDDRYRLHLLRLEHGQAVQPIAAHLGVKPQTLHADLKYMRTRVAVFRAVRQALRRGADTGDGAGDGALIRQATGRALAEAPVERLPSRTELLWRVAGLARAVPPQGSAFPALTAYALLRPVLVDGRDGGKSADPWTFRRWLREAWYWLERPDGRADWRVGSLRAPELRQHLGQLPLSPEDSRLGALLDRLASADDEPARERVLDDAAALAAAWAELSATPGWARLADHAWSGRRGQALAAALHAPPRDVVRRRWNLPLWTMTWLEGLDRAAQQRRLAVGPEPADQTAFAARCGAVADGADGRAP